MSKETRERWKARLAESAPPVLGAWIAVVLLHVVLSAVAPRGVLTDVGLPFYGKFLLLCTEATALGLCCTAGAAFFGALTWGERRIAGRTRLVPRAARALLAGGLALAYATTWAAFWIGGRFIDRQGIGFYFGNAGIMLDYALEMNPVALRVLPVLAILVGVALAEGLPRLARLLTERGRRAVAVALAAGIAFCGLGTVAAEALRWGGTRSVVDAETGLSFSLGEYYELRRDFRSGPLVHAFLATDKARALRDDPMFAGAPGEEERRPLLSVEAHKAGVDPSRVKPWNVVVVLVDSLRADQLRAFGGAREVMPHLEKVAAESRLYVNAHSNGTMTDIAAPCPNTSHYPLRQRTLADLESLAAYPRVLIYDVLKAFGYRTAFVASNNEYFGGTIHLLWSPSLDLFHTAGARVGPEGPVALGRRQRLPPASDDARTLDEALRWLESSGEAPFYLYLNLQNGHAPYRVPDGAPRPFGKKKPEYSISAGYFPLDRLSEVKDVYADSLHYVDAQLGRLIGRLKASGQWERTVFVLSADHGEAFHEHGFGGHGARPYEEIARVPLIVKAPDLAPGPDRTPAQLIDIAPTVCGLLGIPPHPSFQGVDLRSEAAKDQVRFISSQTVLVRDYGVLKGGYKLIYDADAGRYHLFDLVQDPGERKDLAAENPEVVKDLAARLHAWRRMQIGYYEDRSRWAGEYPPVLKPR